jgi:sugar lactone lactonase YvrE
MKRVILLLAVLMLIVPAAAQDATPEPTAEAAATPEATTDAAGTPDTSGEGSEMAGELPNEVVFESPVPGLLPEGVEWNAEAGTFLVGSLSSGTIRTVNDDGTVTDLFVDEDLASTVGIHAAGGKLYVANSSAEVMSNPAATGLASLVVYDLTTGERVSYTDLTGVFEGEGSNFANDVTVDGEGNAYVTNSFQPVIYKVTPEGEGSVFLTSDLLSAEGFGLNGIEYHAHGFLLAVVSGNSAIVKVPLDDPESAALVELSEPVSIDGMAIGSDGIVYAVARTGDGETQEIVALASEDEWETAEIIARTPTGGNATTLALRYDGESNSPAVYYVNTYFGQTERTEYEIVRAPLELPEDVSEEAEG